MKFKTHIDQVVERYGPAKSCTVISPGPFAIGCEAIRESWSPDDLRLIDNEGGLWDEASEMYAKSGGTPTAHNPVDDRSQRFSNANAIVDLSPGEFLAFEELKSGHFRGQLECSESSQIQLL